MSGPIEESVAGAVGDRQPAMPEAWLLNYIGGVTTPTRVRKVAAVGVGCFSGVYFLGAGYVLFTVIYSIVGAWQNRMAFYTPLGLGPVVPPTFRELFIYKLHNSVPELFFMCVLSVIGLMLLGLARLVRRGRGWACYLSMLPGAATMPFCVLGAVTSGCAFLIQGFGLWRMRPNIPLALLMLVLFWASCAALLVLRDLITYLRWIAIQPVAEKEFVAFWPWGK